MEFMNFVLEINIYPHKITLEQTPKLVQINRSIGIGQIVVYRFPILHTFMHLLHSNNCRH